MIKLYSPARKSSGRQFPDIERYHGLIVAVKGIPTKSPSLPDWMLSYVEFPTGEMKEYRSILTKADATIIKVTESRIYFEQ